MRQGHKGDEVELIKNRLYQGGKISQLWKMFVAAQLTGEFSFLGREQSTAIRLMNGRVKDLTFRGRHITITGMAGLNAFKTFIRQDATVRFSIMVTETEGQE